LPKNSDACDREERGEVALPTVRRGHNNKSEAFYAIQGLPNFFRRVFFLLKAFLFSNFPVCLLC
jgi:hypothetical protein